MSARLRNGLFVLPAAGCLALAAWWLLRDGSDSAGTELPPPAGSPFASTSSAAEWIGSDACRECHSDQHRTWLETAHSVALSSVKADREPPDGTITLEDDHRVCTVYRQDGELRHREELLLPDGGQLPLADHAVDYVMGSGRFSRSYLVETNGFLVESPVTWYAARQKWGPSPGYAGNWSGFERPAELRCVECHVGRVTPIENSLHRLAIHEQSIGCERCHGPGSAHRARWSAADAAAESARLEDGDRTIVHPGRLNRERNESICAQCHLHGDATVSIRGRSLADFRPGLRLRDFQVSFSVGTDKKPMEVVGHVEQMRRSACYLGSETLTCTTCHDPHSRPAESESLNWYRSRCLSCHTADSCGMEHAVRILQQPEDNCMACHMPQVPTEIPHFTFTHHLIGIHTELPKPAARGTVSSFDPPGELIPLSDTSHLPLPELDRLKALGYLQLQTVNPLHAAEYTRLALELLLKCREVGLQDPDIDAALSRLYWQSDSSLAMQYAEKVLAAEAPSPEALATALYVHGNAAFDLGRTAEAAASLEKLVQVRRYGHAWYQLSLCRDRLGNRAGALEAAEKAVEITSQGPRLHKWLAELYERAGQTQKARASARRAAELAAAVRAAEAAERNQPGFAE